MNIHGMANDMTMALLDSLTDDDTLEVMAAVFDGAEGSTVERLREAMTVVMAQRMKPEPQLDLPEGWEKLPRRELERLFEAVGLVLMSTEWQNKGALRRRVERHLERQTQVNQLIDSV